MSFGSAADGEGGGGGCEGAGGFGLCGDDEWLGGVVVTGCTAAVAGVVMGWPAVMGLWMMGWAPVVRLDLGFRGGQRL